MRGARPPRCASGADEWIELGAMEALREKALAAYDRLIGLDLLDVAVDGCITKAPCGGEKAGRSPVDRGKQGIKRSAAVDALGIPLGIVTAPANRHDSPLLAPTLDAVVETLGGLPEGTSVHLDRGYDSDLTRRAPGGSGAAALGDLQEKQADTVLGHQSVGSGEDEFVAQRPQEEAGVVYGA